MSIRCAYHINSERLCKNTFNDCSQTFCPAHRFDYFHLELENSSDTSSDDSLDEGLLYTDLFFGRFFF